MNKPNSEQRRRLRNRVWLRDGGLCWICRAPVSKKEMTLDHVVPKSKGGGNALGNLRAAHKKCNSSRGNKDAHEVVLGDEWARISEQKRDES